MGRGHGITVTNDGATILKSVYVDNPAAKVLVGECYLSWIYSDMLALLSDRMCLLQWITPLQCGNSTESPTAARKARHYCMQDKISSRSAWLTCSCVFTCPLHRHLQGSGR